MIKAVESEFDSNQPKVRDLATTFDVSIIIKKTKEHF